MSLFPRHLPGAVHQLDSLGRRRHLSGRWFVDGPVSSLVFHRLFVSLHFAADLDPAQNVAQHKKDFRSYRTVFRLQQNLGDRGRKIRPRHDRSAGRCGKIIALHKIKDDLFR